CAARRARRWWRGSQQWSRSRSVAESRSRSSSLLPLVDPACLLVVDQDP
ncbi:MAG: hypothetical protein AVDCRST_MAG10-942, partial [uncultured Acidimicrobiales bacterium]